MTTQPNTKLVTIKLHDLQKLFNLLSELEHTLDEGIMIKPDTPKDGCAKYGGDPDKVTFHQRISWLTTGLNVAVVEAWSDENVIFNITKVHASYLRDKLTLILAQCLPGGSWPGVDIWMAPGGVLDVINTKGDDSDDLMLLNPDEDAVEALIVINDVVKRSGC